MNRICISEPEDENNPRTPLTPETIERTPETEKPNNKNQLTPTINEENELDNEQLSNNKSSLSLPVEAVLPGPIERDRRKLSVQGLMAFAERRRSTSTFSDMRKMSVSNGDGIHIRSPGGVGKMNECFCVLLSGFSFVSFFPINQQHLAVHRRDRDHHPK